MLSETERAPKWSGLERLGTAMGFGGEGNLEYLKIEVLILAGLKLRVAMAVV